MLGTALGEVVMTGLRCDELEAEVVALGPPLLGVPQGQSDGLELREGPRCRRELALISRASLLVDSTGKAFEAREVSKG